MIPKSDGRHIVTFAKNATTANIIDEVLYIHKQTANDLHKFAPVLRGSNTLQTCSNVWHFVKENIRYKEDGPTYQWIKTPARIWADKECDCKGYSIFIAACLTTLGIPFVFRFVSYNEHPDATHVYIVANDNGREIPIDCVLDEFNKQLKYTHKYDHMTQIARLSGIGRRGRSILQGRKFGHAIELPAGRYAAPLVQSAKAVEILESDLQAEMHSGNTNPAMLAKYQDGIARIKAIIVELEKPQAQVGFIKKLLTSGKRNKTKAGLQDAAIAKIFLYAFIPTGSPAGRQLVTQLPSVVAEKRNKQMELLNWISKKSMYGVANMVADIRATIARTDGMQPEALLNEMFGLNIQEKEAGIGKLTKAEKKANKAAKKETKKANKLAKKGGNSLVKDLGGTILNEGLDIAADTIPFGNTILNVGRKLVGLFTGAGKKIESAFGFKVPTNLNPEEIAPADSDIEQVARLTETVRMQPIAPASKLIDTLPPPEKATAPNILQAIADTLAAAKTQFANQPKPNNSNQSFDNEEGTGSPYNNRSTANDNDPDTLDPVDIVAARKVAPKAAEASTNNNTMLIGIAALAAVVLATRK